MASTFSSTEPFSSTDHNYKNCRKFWHKKVKVLSLLNPIVQKLLFLPSLLPLLLRRPRVPPYWGQGLLLAEQEHLLSGMRRIAMMASTPLTDVVVWIGDHLGWEDCNDERPPPSQKLLLLGNLNGTNVSRDENENFFLSILCFETRTRISLFHVVFRDENQKIENHF